MCTISSNFKGLKYPFSENLTSQVPESQLTIIRLNIYGRKFDINVRQKSGKYIFNIMQSCVSKSNTTKIDKAANR